MERSLSNRQRARRVDSRSLVGFLDRLLCTFPPRRPADLAVRLVSDRQMILLQRRFRRRRGTTDVLSFPGGRADAEGRRHLGDIAISVEQAARQARTVGRPLRRELESLLLHGYLHLLGYDHERDDGEMRRLERRLARALGRGAADRP